MVESRKIEYNHKNSWFLLFECLTENAAVTLYVNGEVIPELFSRRFEKILLTLIYEQKSLKVSYSQVMVSAVRNE